MDQESVSRLAPLIGRLKRAFAPVRVILFGSRSRDDYTEESDYDLLVVSPKFAGMSFLKRMQRTYGLRGEEDLSVDMLCLTPEELISRRDELSVVGLAVREGVEIEF